MILLLSNEIHSIGVMFCSFGLNSGGGGGGGYSLKHGVRGCSKVLRYIFINFGIPMVWF